MAYNANGGISIAEKSDIKKLRTDLSKVTNASNALHTDVAAIKIKLDNIESVAANKEITPLEIQQLWED